MTYWHIVDCIFVWKYLCPRFVKPPVQSEKPKQSTFDKVAEASGSLSAPFFMAFLIHNVLAAYGYAR